MTFVVHPQVVLREADVAELVLRAPGPRQRRLLLVHRRVKALQPPLQLLLLLVQGRVSVREGGRGAAARRQARGRAGPRREARGRRGRAGGGGCRGGGGGGRRRRRSCRTRRSSGPGAARRGPWLGASWGGRGGRAEAGLAMSCRPISL